MEPGTRKRSEEEPTRLARALWAFAIFGPIMAGAIIAANVDLLALALMAPVGVAAVVAIVIWDRRTLRSSRQAEVDDETGSR